MEDIIVSINCITYNHEKYISKALDSFLMQETNFKFEVLIHDDASTDRTSDIIREYQQKYPNIIKPILQKENQQSQGIKKISYRFNHTRAKGKYIAMCEGDDYWTDPYKLQKQVDYMESNPKCTFCFHNGFIVDGITELEEKSIVPWLQENKLYFFNKSKTYTPGELQLLGFIPTASFMYPKKVLDNPPEWFFDAPVADNAIKLIASNYGYAYYMNEKMCVYRTNVNGSAMDIWRKEGASKDGSRLIISRCEKFLTMLDNFNQWSEKKYSDEIDESKKIWQIQMEISKKNRKVLKDIRYKSYFNKLNIKEKIKIYIKLYMPNNMISLIKKIESSIK